MRPLHLRPSAGLREALGISFRAGLSLLTDAETGPERLGDLPPHLPVCYLRARPPRALPFAWAKAAPNSSLFQGPSRKAKAVWALEVMRGQNFVYHNGRGLNTAMCLHGRFPSCPSGAVGLPPRLRACTVFTVTPPSPILWLLLYGHKAYI